MSIINAILTTDTLASVRVARNTSLETFTVLLLTVGFLTFASLVLIEGRIVSVQNLLNCMSALSWMMLIIVATVLAPLTFALRATHRIVFQTWAILLKALLVFTPAPLALKNLRLRAINPLEKLLLCHTLSYDLIRLLSNLLSIQCLVQFSLER